ncbi:MAG: hypothetical protein WA230_23885 [Xanthobacteraceae bacterium]
MGRCDELRQDSRGDDFQDRISRVAALCQHCERVVVFHVGITERAHPFKKRFEAKHARGINEFVSLAARANVARVCDVDAA